MYLPTKDSRNTVRFSLILFSMKLFQVFEENDHVSLKSSLCQPQPFKLYLQMIWFPVHTMLIIFFQVYPSLSSLLKSSNKNKMNTSCILQVLPRQNKGQPFLTLMLYFFPPPPPALLRHNQHITLCNFKVPNTMI